MLTTVRVAAFIFTIIGIFPILSFAQIGFKPEILFGAQGLALGRSALITAQDALAVSLNPAGVTAVQRVTASVAFGRMPANDDAHTSMGSVLNIFIAQLSPCASAGMVKILASGRACNSKAHGLIMPAIIGNWHSKISLRQRTP